VLGKGGQTIPEQVMEAQNMLYLYNFAPFILFTLIPVFVQSKAYICGCSLAGIEGLNPARGMDVLSVVR